MAPGDNTDLFVSDEPEIELEPELQRLLDERIQSAAQGKLISSDAAHAQIREWFSSSSTKPAR